MKRISITLPKNLVNEFDDTLKQKGYNSRADGLKDAIEKYIVFLNENGQYKL